MCNDVTYVYSCRHEWTTTFECDRCPAHARTCARVEPRRTVLDELCQDCDDRVRAGLPLEPADDPADEPSWVTETEAETEAEAAAQTDPESEQEYVPLVEWAPPTSNQTTLTLPHRPRLPRSHWQPQRLRYGVRGNYPAPQETQALQQHDYQQPAQNHPRRQGAAPPALDYFGFPHLQGGYQQPPQDGGDTAVPGTTTPPMTNDNPAAETGVRGPRVDDTTGNRATANDSPVSDQTNDEAATHNNTNVFTMMDTTPAWTLAQSSTQHSIFSDKKLTEKEIQESVESVYLVRGGRLRRITPLVTNEMEQAGNMPPSGLGGSMSTEGPDEDEDEEMEDGQDDGTADSQQSGSSVPDGSEMDETED